MKQILLYTILTSVLFSCKKDNNSGNCKVAVESRLVGGTRSTSGFFYDDLGRIISILNGTNLVEFEYFQDSVKQLIDNKHVYTYYLNSKGLADSSRTYFVPNPNELGLVEHFTYDADGFMTRVETHFSQRYAGNIIIDTTVSAYTVTNGNITRFEQDGFTINYEYGSQSAINNRAVSVGFRPILPFFGKTSNNLLVKSTDDSGGVITYTYNYDSRGRVSIKTAVTTSPTLPPNYTETVEYGYDCD